MKKLYLTLSLTFALFFSIKSFAVPQLNSLPGATAVIFLDFDGHYVQSVVWNAGSPINCAAATMTETQITEAFNRTAEDFRPFDINITTDSAVFLAAPLTKRIRIIITPTSGWYGGVGGVAYIGSFVWGDDTPGFVFCDRLGPNSPKMVGECCSHESGHALGLSHQSKYDASSCPTPIETYNTGTGTGEDAWAPIMGNSYYKNMTGWNNGPTPYGCTNLQDHLSMITTLNGFGYRADDYTETMNVSTAALTAGSFTKNGIINTNTDRDAFKLTILQNTNLHLTAIPFNVGANYIGANLDIKLELYNAAGMLIKTYDPIGSMSVTADTMLNTGIYYIKVDGTGNLNVGEYGSVGSYTLSGFTGALPIHDVSLTGNNNYSKHNLTWNIIADEPIETITLQTSADGINYINLTTANATTKSFSYSPAKSAEIYYRLKVISVLDQTAYSNTIVLKGLNKEDNIFKVSTFIHSSITVNSPVTHQYILSDINGRIIGKGIGAAGAYKIDINNQPNGIYIIQLTSNNKNQTERILKQ